MPLFVVTQPTKEVKTTFYKTQQIYEQYFVLESNPLIKHGPFVSQRQMTKDEWKAYKKGKISIKDFIMYKGFYDHNKKDSVWYEKEKLLTKVEKKQAFGPMQ